MFEIAISCWPSPLSTVERNIVEDELLSLLWVTERQEIHHFFLGPVIEVKGSSAK